MELLNLAFVNTFATALIVCSILSAFIYFFTYFFPSIDNRLFIFIAILAFALLGFVIGYVMSDSRDPSVGSVLPAVLTLLGGISVYLISTQQSNDRLLVSLLILPFSLAMYIGSFYGAEHRGLADLSIGDRLRQLENCFYADRRRQIYLIELKKERLSIESEMGISLKEFVSSLEKAPDCKTEEAVTSYK